MKPVFVGMPEPKKSKGKPDAQAPNGIQKPFATQKIKQKGLLSRIAEIVTDDFNYYLHGAKSKSRQEWEDYEKFCELARKEMK